MTSDYIFKGIFSDESRTKDFLANILVGEGKFFPKDTKIEMARMMIQEGIDITVVSKITGFSEDEIKKNMSSEKIVN